MRMLSIIRPVLLVTTLLIGLSVAASASAVTWRGWNTHATGYPNTVALEHFAHTITEKTDGRIQAKVYNNAVLGDQPQAIQQVMSGALQFGNFNMSPMGAFVPATEVLSLPYLFDSVDQAYKILKGPIGEKLADAMAKKGLIVLSWFTSGARSFYNSKHPIRKPSDVKGLRIRVQDSDLYVNMVKALGGNPTPLPFHQVYTALANGVIDGAENNFPSYRETKHYEVAKYYSLDKHFIIPECLCVSRKAWKALSEKDQKVVRKAAVAAAKEQRRLWAKAAQEARTFVAQHGAIINEIENLEPFQEAMKPVYQTFFEEHPEQRDLVKKIRNMK